MKRKYPKIIRNRKQRIERRLDHNRHWSEQVEPMMSAGNIHYDMAERIRAVNCGGIGAMHLMVKKLGLVTEIDQRVHVLKRHGALSRDPCGLATRLRAAAQRPG